MTVSSDAFREVYTGNGSLDEYDYTWKIYDKTQLLVTEVLIATGAETTLVVDVDYTVTGINQDAGGSITLTAGNLPSTKKIVIIPNFPFQQDIDLTNQASVPPERAEEMGDKLAGQIKQVKEKLDRAVTVPIGSTESPTDYLTTMGVILVASEAAQSAAEAAQSAAEAAQSAAEQASNNAVYITTTAGIDDAILTVAGIAANVTMVAGISANVTTVAGISAAVVAVDAALSGGVLDETFGGTGQNTITQGDILYGSAANTLSKLAKNASATRYMSNTGTDNNPAWAQVNLANGVTGTLPVANGGTGGATAIDGRGGLNIKNIQTVEITIAEDAVGYIDMSASGVDINSGFFFITLPSITSTSTNVQVGCGTFRMGGTSSLAQSIFEGANFDIVTSNTTPTGTSGVDGNTTVYIDTTNDRFYINNRSGAGSLTYAVTFVGR